MTIQDAERFVAGLWDWAILEGCFGNTKIMPTDIDGFVERNGYFLLLETKAPKVELKQGQVMAFERLSRTRVVTVMILWGRTNVPEEVQVFGWNATSIKMPCNLDKMRYLVKKWFDYSDKRKPITILEPFILKKAG